MAYSNRLSLHWFDAAFPVEPPTLEGGTQLPGELCGTPIAATSRFEGFLQNNFVRIEPHPNGTDDILTNIACPTSGLLDDAEIQIRVVPRDFRCSSTTLSTPLRTLCSPCPPPGLFVNDIDVGAGVLDVESGPASGQVTVSSDGSFTYTPNMGFCRDDEFTYRVTLNGVEYLAVATVSVCP